MASPLLWLLITAAVYLLAGAVAVVFMFRARRIEHWLWWHYLIALGLWPVIAFGAVSERWHRRG
jgi:cell division protein FtsW (lipid II flippase)